MDQSLREKFLGIKEEINHGTCSDRARCAQEFWNILWRLQKRPWMCINPRRKGRSICFKTTTMTRRKLSYPDLELVAVVHALKEWRHCLLGNRCEIYTDHKSLKYIFTQPELNLRQRRWLELIKDYDVGIHYHPGKENVVADALSQNPCTDSDREQFS